MANLSVSVWKGSNTYAHTCKSCGKPFKIRHKRVYPMLCSNCAKSYNMTNQQRKRRGQKPLNINEYRCVSLAKKIYKILSGR